MGPTSLFQGEGEKVGYRRVSPVPGRPGEGPLTERTAGVQPAQSERVFMPLFGRCLKQAKRRYTGVPHSTRNNFNGNCLGVEP